MIKTRTRRSAIQGGPGGLMPLVDILFATLGVFVIVLTTQELLESVPKVEVPADAVVICADENNLTLALAGVEARQTLSVQTLGAGIAEALPKGGNIVIGIEDGCLSGQSSAFLKIETLDDSLAAISDGNVFFRMRYIPLGGGAFSAEALIAGLQGNGTWPPSAGAEPT